MKISYNKLWKLLIDKKIPKGELRIAIEAIPTEETGKMQEDYSI